MIYELLALSLLALNSAIVSTAPASGVDSTSQTAPGACSTAEYRSFDFWVGDWEVFDFDNQKTPVARTRVDSILGGCVLHEDYRESNGYHGESFTIYDSVRKVWHQTWVTNHGKLLVIEGKMDSGAMVLSGVDHAADGKEQIVRGIWKAVEGGVRETAVDSADGGKTWTPWFDLMFRPSRSFATMAASDDQETLRALDVKYQAAVKVNDVATMDLLLADDFLLVTGSGKTYTKEDLLDEARSGRFVYSHQEDTSQNVRVWGDSAVVTAKLWAQGTEAGRPFDYIVWFSDIYVRTSAGWKYVFGQSSLPLASAKLR